MRRIAPLIGLMAAFLTGCGSGTTPELGDAGLSAKPLEQLPPKRPTNDSALNAFLDKVVKVYADAKSYRDSGTVVRTEAPRTNPDQKSESTRKFRTLYSRPDRFRLDLMSGDGDTGKTEVYWTESGPSKLNVYAGDPPATSEKDMLGGLPLTDPIAKIIPRLLIKEIAPGHRRTLDRVEAPELAKETEEIDGRKYYVFNGNYDGSFTTAYIDAETLLIKKVVQRSSTQGTQIETTISYEPELDVEIPAADFAYTPPAA